MEMEMVSVTLGQMVMVSGFQCESHHVVTKI